MGTLSPDLTNADLISWCLSCQLGRGQFMEGHMAAPWTMATRMSADKECLMLPCQQVLVLILHPSEKASAQCDLGGLVWSRQLMNK